MELKDIKDELLGRLDLPSSTVVTGDTRLLEDLGMDSLDAYELVYHAECRFDVRIDDKVAMKIETVQDAINVINERL